MVNDSQIIVALDYSDTTAALSLVDRLEPGRCKLKVGNELFCRAGPAMVSRLIAAGFDVFLDLKFHDIPNTVERASRAAVDLGVWMFNVHAGGGAAMLHAARKAVPTGNRVPLLIAVTVLTSLSADALPEVGINDSPADQVLRLARLSRDCGLDGVVCSAREAGDLRRRCGDSFVLVTPGIRPTGSVEGDQRRVVTPSDAVKAGSSYLVIGRPITAAAEPMEAIAAIEQELAGCARGITEKLP
jgi:orotidine-5'-phosphate decarboxylase